MEKTTEYWLTRAIERTGSRDERAFWLAAQLRDNRVPEREAKEAMRMFAQSVTGEKNHPYRENEAMSSYRSAMRHPPRDPVNGEHTEEPLRVVQRLDEMYDRLKSQVDWTGVEGLDEPDITDTELARASAERLFQIVRQAYAGEREDEMFYKAMYVLGERFTVLLRVFTTYATLHSEEFRNTVMPELEETPDDLFELLGIDRQTYTWSK